MMGTRSRWVAVLTTLLLVLGALSGCGTAKKSAQPETPSGSTSQNAGGKAYDGMENVPAIADAASEAEKNRIAALIKGAKEEQGLNWYGPMIEPQQAEPFLTAFKQYYGLESLKTAYTYGSPGEVVTKVEELLRANRNDVDLVWNSAYSWYQDLEKRGLLLEYESPEYASYVISKEQGSANTRFWVSDAYAFHPSYNAEIMAQKIGPDWKPTSWKDFADPRLKGLVSVGDVMGSTSHAQTMQGLEKALGREYFEQLKQNVDPVTFNRSAQGRDWVATGEYPITLSSHAKNTETLRSRGVKGIVLVYPKEGIVLLPFTLAILKNTASPNAAKLFVDFARSVKGQEVLLKAGSMVFPGRKGVKSPDPELLPAVEDLKLVPIDWNTEGTNEAITEVRNMWRELGLAK